MEDQQAERGNRCFDTAIRGIANQRASQDIPLDVKLRLKDKRNTQRAERERQGIPKPTKAPFHPGRDTMTKSIPPVHTGRQSGSFYSVAPYPGAPTRSIARERENAQSGPSRPLPGVVAGSRKNLQRGHDSEDEFEIQSDPRHDTRAEVDDRDVPGRTQLYPHPHHGRPPLSRSDIGHYHESAYLPGDSRRRQQTASTSRSISPQKCRPRRSSPRPNYFENVRDEAQESIENPDGPFRMPDEDYCVPMPTVPPAHSMAEKTRSAMRQSTGSRSPTKAIAAPPSIKGKGKAVADPIFEARPPSKQMLGTRQPTMSKSPTKESPVPSHKAPPGNSETTNGRYVELDDPQTNNEDGDGDIVHQLTIDSKKAIPSSGLHKDGSSLDTRVVRCWDSKRWVRKMYIKRIQLHEDGISLDDPEDRKGRTFYIKTSIMIESQCCVRKDCPLIMLTISIPPGHDVVLGRLRALIAPSNVTGLPTWNELSTVTLNIPLQPGERAQAFVIEYSKRNRPAEQQGSRRLGQEQCQEHRGGEPDEFPPRVITKAQPDIVRSAFIEPPKSASNRTLELQSDHPKRQVQVVLNRSKANSPPEQSTKPKEKGKQRELDPPEVPQGKIAKLAAKVKGPVVRASARLFGAKPTAPENIDSDDDEVHPLLPKAAVLQPPPDRGTILFPYPLSGRATLTITKGELWRVQSGEFLNDTLIEWGLQHLLSILTNSITAEDVHLFNSFFYTKISSKDRDKKLQPRSDSSPARWPAFETIRKWTKSVDVFSKKFIIVPINEDFHWYLAVIFNPGGMLVQPPLEAPALSTDKAKTSPDGSLDAKDENVIDAELDQGAEGSDPNISDTIMAVPESSERMDIDVKEDSDTYLDGDGDESIDPIDSIDRTPARQMKDLDITSNGRRHQRTRPPPPAGKEINSSTLDAIRMQDEFQASRIDKPLSRTEPVKVVPVKAERLPDHNILNSQKPWIITFDSLGSPHKAVGTALTQWLRWEAGSKKGGQYDHVQVEYTHAQVPLQTNFSDCGLYLVHYAHRLLDDPETILKFVERRLPRKDSEERKQFDADIDKIWGISRDHNLRDEWQAKINSLKEQYEGQKVEKPTSDTSEAKTPRDTIVPGDDSGEGFTEEVTPVEGTELRVPAPENATEKGDEAAEGSDHIVAEAARNYEDQQHSLKPDDLDPVVSESEPQQLQHTTLKSDEPRVMPDTDDELEPSDEDDHEYNYSPSSPEKVVLAVSHLGVIDADHNPWRKAQDEILETGNEVTALERNDQRDGRSQSQSAEMDEHDDVDPLLAGLQPSQPEFTRNLEDESMGSDRYQHSVAVVDQDAGGIELPQGSAESIRMIQKADLVHASNPHHSQNTLVHQDPGSTSEHAIDVNTDNEDNYDSDWVRPDSSNDHRAAESLGGPDSRPASTTGAKKPLFGGLTPNSASHRKSFRDGQLASSPHVPVANTAGQYMNSPSTAKVGPLVDRQPPPSSPLTSIGTSRGDGDASQVPPPFRAESPKKSSAKPAPPAATPSIPPWSDSNSGIGPTRKPAQSTPRRSELNKFANLPSDSSAASTPVRPTTAPRPGVMMPDENSASRSMREEVILLSSDSDHTMSAPNRRQDPGPSNSDEHTPGRHLVAFDSIRDNQDVSSSRLGPDSLESLGEDGSTTYHLNLLPQVDPTPEAVTSPAGSARSLRPEQSPSPEKRGAAPSTFRASDLMRRQTRSSRSDIIDVDADGHSHTLENVEGKMIEDACPSSATQAGPHRRSARQKESEIILMDINGQEDDLNSRSDEDVVHKRPRHPSPRHKPTSPEVTGDQDIHTLPSSSDDEHPQPGRDSPGFGERNKAPRSAARPQTYGKKGKNKAQASKKPNSSTSTQSKLPYKSAPSNETEAGPSTTKKRNGSATQMRNSNKRLRVNLNESAGHTPAKRGTATRKGKRRVSGETQGEPIEVDSD